MIRSPEAAARKPGTTNGPMSPMAPPSMVTAPRTPPADHEDERGGGRSGGRRTADRPLAAAVWPDGSTPTPRAVDGRGVVAVGRGRRASGQASAQAVGAGRPASVVGRGVGTRRGLGVGLGAAQLPVGGMTVLVSRVMAPFWANARPPFRPPPTPMDAPVFIVMLTRAIRLPCSDVAVPIVAELPTAQNTAQPCGAIGQHARARPCRWSASSRSGR